MEQQYDIIVIGAGPAGLSAGIYAARAKFHVLIIDKGDIGGQITITNEVVNYPGIERTTGTKLTQSMKKQCEYFGASFLNATVRSVYFSKDRKIIQTDKGDFTAFGVIIATGSNPRTIGFPGESEFKGRGIAYCATCDGEFFTGLDVFVIGAGFAAAEEAMFLTRYAKKVTVIARGAEFSCAKSIADKVLAHAKIEVKFNTEVLEVGGDTSLKYAKFINNVTKETWEYHVEPQNSTFGVFVFAGYVPASDLFQGHIQINDHGYIDTDENRQTNVPGVYAAGDICVKNLRQVVTAVSDGAIAATSLEKYVEEIYQKLGLTHQERKMPDHKNEVELQDMQISSNTLEPTGFITNEMKEQLKPVFQRMENTIEVLGILDPDIPISTDVGAFLYELSDLSEKIEVHTVGKGEAGEFEEEFVKYYPCIALFDSKKNYLRVQFHGVPGGHEFNSFIIALYNASGPGQPLEEATLQKIQSITKPVHMKAAVSLSCTMCPEVVMASQRMALLNPNITAEMLDISLYPELKDKFSIMSVPCLIINNDIISFGKKNIEEICELIS